MIDIKQLNEFAGTNAENLEQFKEQFQSKFVLKENAPKDPEIVDQISGRVLGSEMTNLKRMFKQEGIEFSEDEFKSIKKNEEMVSLALNKLKGNYINQVEEMKNLSSSGIDEKIKEFQEKISKIEKEKNDIKAAWKSTADEYEKYKVDIASNIKNKEIQFRVSKAKESLKFRQKINEAEKAGFEAILNNKLSFDLDESSGNLITMNKSGERIKSKIKAGDFMTAEEAIQEIVNDLGLGETNPHAGKPVLNNGPITSSFFGNKNQQQVNNNSNEINNGRKVLIHPKAMKK
jgi:hypothetical protein